MYIKNTVKESGQDFCLVLNDIGEEFKWTKNEVKNSILNGIIQFENARLSPAGRLFIDKKAKVNINPHKNVGNYKRTPEIQKLSHSEKVRYYWDVFYYAYSAANMCDYTIDELDCILTASLDLEYSEHGSSSTDIILSKNMYYFSIVGAVIKESIRRKYLTEEECRDYLLGFGDKGRYCNRYTFAEWIMRHKRGR